MTARTRHRNLVLAGFMGTGKSVIGRMVADRLGLSFVDTDAVIEARAGRTVARIFAEEGEAAFRAHEAAICQEAAARCHQVIAVGGGALLDDQTRQRVIERALVVCLICELDEIVRRVGNDPARPLFSPDPDRLAALLAARAAHYSGLPHHVDTTHRTPDDVVAEVIRLWLRH